MLQYQTRAGILPNPCNCGFFVNEGLQRISLYVKSRFCLETHAANSQRCRCNAFSVPPPGFDIVFLQLAGKFKIFFHYSNWGKPLRLSTLSEPIPDLFSPNLYSIVVLRITLFEVLQKTLNHFASR